MFNLLKMDLRRLFRSRGFYIMLCVTAVFLVTLVILVSSIAREVRSARPTTGWARKFAECPSWSSPMNASAAASC